MHSNEDYEKPAELLLVERTRGIRVLPHGRIIDRGAAGHPEPAVIDHRGHEVEWLSAVFFVLRGHGYSVQTIRTYSEAFLRFARCAWALDLDMVDLRPGDYEVLKGLLIDPRRNSLGREYAPRSLLVSEAALLTIYEIAVERNFGPTQNPVSAVVKKHKSVPYRTQADTESRRAHRKTRIATRPTAVGPILTTEERKILRSVEHPLDRALVQTLDEAGPRFSEVLSIRLINMKPQSHEIVVYGKGPGGGRPRPLFASPKTFKAINDYVDYLDGLGVEVGHSDPIFRRESNYERPLTRWGVDRRLAAIVPGATPQKFRRTTATRLVEAFDGLGHANMVAVREILGHSSIMITEQYLNFTRERLYADMLDALERDVPREVPDVHALYRSDIRADVDSLKREEDGS